MTGFLDNIDTPSDLKRLSLEKLPALAKELRKFIIENVAETGGHLAPSLGVVELTIALLYVFNPPEDKIIWDVGHQAYAYKILTGRKDRFHTLRQYGGISGFCKREESIYDSWGVGHASTSISAAMGFAINRDLDGRKHNIVAIVGDGALTGGLAFEGLNNVGASGTEMLVILNDNAMSISKNVGAIAKYLTEIVASPTYQKVKSDIWELTGKAGEIGKYMRTLARKLEDSFKNLIVPGMLFEHLGFEYYGPIDGHDISEMVRVLKETKDVKKPKFLHVITKKGKGFKPAELDATKYHGLGRYDLETGEPYVLSGELTYTQVFGQAMVELGEKFPDLVAITAAMETGTGLAEFRKKFPKRFFDVGIAEAHAVIFGATLAVEGKRTVVAIYSTFLQRAYDQIIHDVSLQNIPLVIAMDRAGIVGEDGPTHHGVFDISYMSAVPNFVIASPANGTELRNMLFTALAEFAKPWVIRYPRATVPDLEFEKFKKIAIGSWEILRSGDGKLLILAVGSMVAQAEKALQKISDKTISPTLVNCRFIKPFDKNLLHELLAKHSFVLTVEEGTISGGFGESIARFIVENKIDIGGIKLLGLRDEFVPHGDREKLLEISGLGIDEIANEIISLYSK